MPLLIISYIYFPGAIIAFYLAKLVYRIEWGKDYKEDWSDIKQRIILSLCSWLGVVAFVAILVINLFEKLEKKEGKPPKWL